MFLLFYRLILQPVTTLAAESSGDSIVQTALKYFAPNIQLDGLTDTLVKVIVIVIGVTKAINGLAITIIEHSTEISLSHQRIGDGWSYSIFFVNIIAIFILLAIALANTLRLNLETYAIKKTLPSLIIGFVLANLSFLVSRALLDLSDLINHEVDSLFVTGNTSIIQTIVDRTTGIDISPDKTNVLDAIFAIFSNQNAGQGINQENTANLGFILDTLNKLGGGVEMQQIILIIELLIVALFLILPTLVIVALAFVAIARQIILYILIILAPLGIILLSFPPTKSIGQKWLGQYLSWIFIIPLILFILGIATIFLPDSPQAIKEILTNTDNIDTSPEGNFVSAIIGYISGIFVLVTALTIPLSLSGSSGGMISNMMMYGAMSQGGNLIGGLFGKNKGGNTSNINTNIGGQGIGGATTGSGSGSSGANTRRQMRIGNTGRTSPISGQDYANASQPGQTSNKPTSNLDKAYQTTLAVASAIDQYQGKVDPNDRIFKEAKDFSQKVLGFQQRMKADTDTFFNPNSSSGTQNSSSPAYSSATISAAAGSLSSLIATEPAVGAYGQALLKSNTFTPEQIKMLQSTSPEKVEQLINSRAFNANLNNTIDLSQNNLGQYLDKKQVSANNTVTLGQLAKSYNEKFNDAAKNQATSIAKETKLSTAQIKQVNNYMSQNNIQAALKAADGDQRVTNLINNAGKNNENITYVNNTLDKLIQVKETEKTVNTATPVQTAANNNINQINNVLNQTTLNSTATNNFAANTNPERVSILQNAGISLNNLNNNNNTRKFEVKNLG
ncbi:MAG: type IV secretion system protein [Patescibacteria group bacterium]